MTPEDSVDCTTPFLLSRRYEYVRTIGRGGMGEVFLVRDRQLQRELALKVLMDSRSADPAFVDRFIEEAQIAAQLQHPGIVPIHDIGKLDDQRPFFTMKLVRGETLESLLSRRSGIEDSLDRWLRVYLQICQAVAYAHSKGVIHRDLKPSNVMVDRFGEVQVMDWGLAKILTYSQRPATSEATRTSHESQPASLVSLPTAAIPTGPPSPGQLQPSIVRSIRYSPTDQEFPSTQRSLEWKTDAGSLTHQGYILGTVAFMPPEQARGCVDQLDSRCDVFALGAILCVILTGKPPYYCDTEEGRYQMATNGELEECFERLRATTLDEELIQVCVLCLTPDLAERPRDASVVASQISAYLTKVRQRLHQAELASAEAAAKLEAAAQAQRIEQQRQRWVRATVGSLGLCVVLGLAATAWIRQRESDLSLAVSNQKLALLEREKERIERIDQSRLALEKIIAPMRLMFEQISNSQQPPTHAQLEQLASTFEQTRSAYEAADQEARQQWDLDSWRSRLERLRYLSQLCQELPNKIDREWISANLLVDLSDQGSAGRLAESIQQLPRWARDQIAIAVTDSAYQHGILPLEWADKCMQSESERALWLAIQAKDWSRLAELASEDSLDSLPLALQLHIVAVLIETGPTAMAERVSQELEWVLMHPKLARNEWDDDIPVSEDGWVETRKKGGMHYRVFIDVPAVPLNWFRIETHCGPRMPNLENNEETVESSDEPPWLPIRTAPTASWIEETSDRVGPGLAGEGPDFCHVRELRISRVHPEHPPVPLQFSQVYSGHTTVPGREADRAVDKEGNTTWALGHADGLELASTFFEVRPLKSTDLYPELHIEIDTGDLGLWQWTNLGRFRLYYAREPTLPDEGLIEVAERIVSRLNRSYPANSKILGLQARIKVSTGKLDKLERETALALASTAASIDGFDISALKLFTEMTLAMHPTVESTSYRELLDQIHSVSGSRAASEAIRRIALYQRQRGDLMFSMHPDSALEAYRESEKLDPANFCRYGRLAWELTRRGQPDTAMHMARKGVSDENCHWEDLFYFGDIAIRGKHFQEAWEVYEKHMQGEEFQENSKLLLIYGRLAFLNGFVDSGIRILEKLGSKVGVSSAIISAAAHGMVTSNHQNRLPWLLEFWQQNDVQDVSQFGDFGMLRERRYTWGTLAYALIHAAYDQELAKVLVSHSKRHPRLLDEIIVSMDQMLLARMAPRSTVIDIPNSRKLMSIYRSIEPQEPRWIIRTAVLAWLEGQLDEAMELLGSLPFDQRGNGDSILQTIDGRSWQAMARVCLATIRTVERIDLEMALEYEIEAAQKCLGRVPLGDQDLAEWLWWEYRLSTNR